MTTVIIDSIEETSFIQDDDGNVFADNVRKEISRVQSKGLFVDIQYKQSVTPVSVLVYSALILGKKKKEMEVM